MIWVCGFLVLTLDDLKESFLDLIASLPTRLLFRTDSLRLKSRMPSLSNKTGGKPSGTIHEYSPNRFSASLSAFLLPFFSLANESLPSFDNSPRLQDTVLSSSNQHQFHHFLLDSSYSILIKIYWFDLP